MHGMSDTPTGNSSTRPKRNYLSRHIHEPLPRITRKEEHHHPKPLNKRKTQYPMYPTQTNEIYSIGSWPPAFLFAVVARAQQQPPRTALLQSPTLERWWNMRSRINLRCSKPWRSGDHRPDHPGKLAIVSQLEFTANYQRNIDLQTSIIGGNPIQIWRKQHLVVAIHWHADHLQPGCLLAGARLPR